MKYEARISTSIAQVAVEGWGLYRCAEPVFRAQLGKGREALLSRYWDVNEGYGEESERSMEEARSLPTWVLAIVTGEWERQSCPHTGSGWGHGTPEDAEWCDGCLEALN